MLKNEYARIIFNKYLYMNNEGYKIGKELSITLIVLV